jgi:hypothetical protein
LDELADPALVSRSDQSLADASAIDVDGPCMPDPNEERTQMSRVASITEYMERANWASSLAEHRGRRKRAARLDLDSASRNEL